MQDWEDIETAPKDGTRVLLWSDDAQAAMTGKWESERTEDWEMVDRETKKLVVRDTGWWHADGEGYNFTHWMPLPDPPAPGVPRQEEQ